LGVKVKGSGFEGVVAPEFRIKRLLLEGSRIIEVDD
jgi:hypothetical protein